MDASPRFRARSQTHWQLAPSGRNRTLDLPRRIEKIRLQDHLLHNGWSIANRDPPGSYPPAERLRILRRLSDECALLIAAFPPRFVFCQQDLLRLF